MGADIPVWLGGLFAFLFGASIGSFVNVVAYRLPRDLSIITPRSFCPECERELPVLVNIPIVSYLALRGRCLMCGAAIPMRHFMAELGLAVAALYLYLSFPLADAFARLVFCAALFAIALIDYDWRLIPNLITMPGIPIGIIAAVLAIPEVGLKSSLIGVAFGWGFLFLTGEAYFRLRGREGVGMGDVWLMGMTGAFIGWPGAAFTLFVGSILGSIGGIVVGIGGEYAAPKPDLAQAADASEAEASMLRTEVPFGPFLALAAGIYTLFQPQLFRWYLGG